MTKRTEILERPSLQREQPSASDDVALTRRQGLFQSRAWKNYLRNRFGVLGAIMIGALLVVTLAAPLVTSYEPSATDAYNLVKPPSSEHWLGTDAIGRDMWSRVVFGGRISLLVGALGVMLQTVIGTIMGAISGFFGGWVDNVIQRLVEVMQVFPDFMMLLIMVSLLGPSLVNLFIAIALLNWHGVCRLIRGQILTVREEDYILAARSIGVDNRRIIFRHILPNLSGIILVSMVTSIGGFILLEASLSFVGLGVQPPTPSWGNLIFQANNLVVLQIRPWLWIPPGVAVILCVLGFNFVGDALRDVFDPHRQQ